MNKNNSSGNLLIEKIPINHFLLIMRTTIFLLFTCVFCSMAELSYTQNARVTINKRNATIKEILNEIEKQTDYLFIYNNEVNTNEKVSVKAKQEAVSSVLNSMLKDKDMNYLMEGNHIILFVNAKEGSANKDESFVAQQQKKTITGKVVDANGVPIIGANIVEVGTTNGAVTDIDGKFTIDVADNAAIRVSYIGYLEQEVSTAGKNTLNITLVEDTKTLEEVVVVGYGTQKKGALTGAVSAVSSKEIQITKNENIQNMLTGKIPGVRVVQRTAEPGSFDNHLDIRAMGSPLIVIDGVPRSMQDFQRLNPEDVDNISVLKDASAAVYGVRAANGVMLVTTKRGTVGKSQISYTGSSTLQMPSGLPATCDAIEYMTLWNEKSMHNINGGSLIYSDQDFEDYLTGKKESIDWYSLVFKNSPQTMHNLSATGGSEKIKYYVGLGYQYQEGFFKSSDLTYERYNIRSNITANIVNNLTLDAQINLVMDQQNRPRTDSWWIIRAFWRQPPTSPPYANNDPTKPFHGYIEGDNPISFMNADIEGYAKTNNKWVDPTLSLSWDIPWVKGLYLKGMFAYNWYLSDANQYQKEYNQYRYDETSDTYQIFTRNSPGNIRRENSTRYQLLTQTTLGYSGNIDNHNYNGLLVWESQKTGMDNYGGQRNLILPIPYLFAGETKDQQVLMNSGQLYDRSNLGLIGSFHYDYSGKYLADVGFRYDGSSMFVSGNQWGFFPSISGGWRISEEKFFKNAFPQIDQLKLRASYGILGDDGASQYQFISGYNYPTDGRGRGFNGGYVFDGNFLASADNKGIPNLKITWFTAKTFDVGFDFVAWNGLLGITFDYFQRKREGLLATRYGGIPTVVGASLPQENLNSDLTFGTELEISHRNRIQDVSYGLKGFLTIARVKRLYVERGPIGSSWSNWKNNQNDRLQGIHWGLQGDGQFQNWDEIWSSPVYIGRSTLPGDYRYEDWNGDGEINDNDVHPVRFNQYPWMNFSFSGDVQYKGFDLAFLFQGSAMSSLLYPEQLHEPLWGSQHSSAMKQFMDRWHPVDPKVDPYDPFIQWESGYYAYTGTLSDYNSTFNVVNGAYLRLKSIELGYSLPANLTKTLGIANIRIFANAYNLFTLTKVNFVDPEHPADTYGYLYPLNKTASLGLNVTF